MSRSIPDSLEEAQAWLDRSSHDGQVLEQIREFTASRATDRRLAADLRKQWAELSLQVNARSHGDGPWQQARMIANECWLRTLIIEQLGADPEGPRWDPNRVASDLFGALPLTPTQARMLSERWQDRAVEQIGELRRVKNITAPLQQLLPHLPQGEIHDQAQQWLDIRQLLP